MTFQVLAFSQTPNRELLVFWLAGQSNMEGQGVVDLDHPEYYNGGRGILNTVIRQNSDRWGFLKNDNGEFLARDDVAIRFVTRHGLKKGKLSIGFTGYEGKHHIGPELGFGHVVGDALDSPILLVKTAWGGKSLKRDFRPPSAGGTVGVFYKKMCSEVREAIDQVPEEFPQWKGRKARLAGFVWQQGWNDMVDSEATTEYAQNLVHLIQDIRKEFGDPDLPVVVGELGNMGVDAGESILRFRLQQRLGAGDPLLGGNVAFVATSSFARAKENSPNIGHGHHWFGNAESYLLVGEALGKSMISIGERE
ncbi:MAG: sialate O-acetylesterase [Planctomycetota bacterium]